MQKKTHFGPRPKISQLNFWVYNLHTKKPKKLILARDLIWTQNLNFVRIDMLLLNNVNINKTKVFLPHTYVTVALFYPILFWFFCPLESDCQ